MLIVLFCFDSLTSFYGLNCLILNEVQINNRINISVRCCLVHLILNLYLLNLVSDITSTSVWKCWKPILVRVGMSLFWPNKHFDPIFGYLLVNAWGQFCLLILSNLVHRCRFKICWKSLLTIKIHLSPFGTVFI